MMHVLQSNKGISLTLAVSFLGIARRLGIPMSMVPIPEGIGALIYVVLMHIVQAIGCNYSFLQLHLYQHFGCLLHLLRNW